MADSDEDYYEVPLRDQRYFGAGIKRRRVNFVPATTSLPATPSVQDGPVKSSASQRYLAVVFKKSQSEPPAEEHTVVGVATQPEHDQIAQTQKEKAKVEDNEDICNVCKMPVDPSSPRDSHTSSLVHQICLPHAHPPSALDRKRKGISILSSYGWDPDARTGLGAEGEGILHPVKAKEKRDTVGLGHGKDDEDEARMKPKKKVKKREEVKKLDAGQIRKMDDLQKKKDKRLREMFYANEDVEKYLGGG